MESLLVFLATGAIAGLLAGLFGIGGGMIMVPALALLLPAQGVADDVIMHVAVGTSLAVIAFTSISSMLAHHRRGGVVWPLFRAFAPALAVGAVAGALVADATASDILRRIVGLGALLLAVQMWLDVTAATPARAPPAAAPPAVLHAAAGSVIGLLSALIGIGGGSLTLPYFSWFGVEMRKAVGTAAACGVPIAWAGALAFVAAGVGEPGRPELSLGYVSLHGFAGLAVASVAMAPLGARLAHTLPPRTLKHGVAVLLFAIGVAMLLG